MDSRRAETLEALSAYLLHQRSLLARTQNDIEKLKRLKEDVLASPEQFSNHSNFQENDASTSHLLGIEKNVLDLQEYYPTDFLSAKIDWQAFSSSDATPLRTLAIRTRIDHTQRTVPSNIQRSPLSFLQRFVKDARKVIIDPVFESLSASTDTGAVSNPTDTSNHRIISPSSNDHNHVSPVTLPPSLSEDENGHYPQIPAIPQSMITVRKRGRPKDREPKKRKTKTGGRKPGSSDIFVRHDMENESIEVDVSRVTPQSCLSTPLDGPIGADSPSASCCEDTTHSVELPNPPVTGQLVDSLWDGANLSSRTRKPSLKFQPLTLAAPDYVPSPASGLGKRGRDVEINDESRKSKVESLQVKKGGDQRRSGTYMQAWTVSEQHLLERLLEEIPDGERNRWAKISQAMGGRRTPRQVASRVQKYFEKLKRFGVGVDKKGKAKS